MTIKKTPSPTRRRLSWYDPSLRSWIYQGLILAVVGFVVWYLVSNTLHNLSTRNIATGFGFLHREAGFAIGESAIAYTPADTYGRAIMVGLLNPLKVSVMGVVAATLFGTILGHWARKRQDATGRVLPLGRIAMLLLIGLPVLGWLVSGASLAIDMPYLKGLNFTGGMTLSPEFAALLAGLVLYMSAFVAEVVRSGIQAVDRGQWEAAGPLV